MTTVYTTSAAPPPPGRTRHAIFGISVVAFVLGLLAYSWFGTEMSLGRLVESGPRMAEFLERMFPPNLMWSSDEPRVFAPPLSIAGQTVIITLQISILGTALGMVAALGLGFLASENLTPHWVHHPIKVFLALLRSIPVLLLALLFLIGVGFGALPGVLAIAIHSIGMLGKLFSEECEGVETGVWEAMDSAGANWFQKVRYAIWPQVAAQIYSLTLFRLEMNLRESAVLGLIGIPGLGFWIENYRRAFLYPSVATMVIVTMLVVLVVDQLSFHIRRRLR